jgi:hypothetical protein
MAKFEGRIKKVYIKLKLDDMEDFETEFVDFDFLLSSYIEEFRSFKRNTAKKLQKSFNIVS